MSLTPPTLIVIGGFAGSGKSTLARRLGRHLSILPYEKDAIAKTIRESPHFSGNVGGLAFDLFFSIARQALNNNCSLILDQNMGYTLTWRSLTQFQQEVGQDKVKIFLLNCPFELCLSRFAARTGHPDIGRVTLDDLQQHKFKWDYLQENELPQAIRIDATQSQDAVFAAVLRHLSPRIDQ